MARMFPDRSPLDVRSPAERVLFTALRDGLDADWSVLHSLCWVKEESPGLREGECDFLILHPERGLLALEVKGGSPSFVRGEWRHEDGRRLTDPCAQARRAVHYLADRLRSRVPEWARLQPPFGHAIAFPDADRVVGDLPAHLRPQMILLEPDLQRMQAAVEAALAAWRQPSARLSDEACRRVLDILLPEFSLHPSLRATLHHQRETLLQLGRQQAVAFEMLTAERRLIIEGRAGSGKTLLALRKATALAGEGRAVLLLCYNRPLCERLACEAADVPELKVATFHDLCREIVEAAEGPGGFRVPSSEEAARSFWDEELPGRALAQVASWPQRYDAILADEGQDFRDEWWLLVESLLRDERESRFVIFLDPRQDLYGRSRALPFERPRFPLPYNCRNTRPIAEWVAARADLGPDLSGQPDGEPVRVVRAADDAAERDAVRTLLHELIRRRGLPAASVVVLGKRRLERSPFADGRKLGSFRLVGLEADAVQDDVRYATVHRFKGLEAEAVVLVGCLTAAATDLAAAALERKLQYVGGSRARSILCVIERPG